MIDVVMSASPSKSPEKQRKYKTRVHANSIAALRKTKAPQFEPGTSGNPGGVRKGTVFVSECYKRIMAMSVDEIRAFQPQNGAEAAALKQALNTIDSPALEALPSLKEITDRTEGKAPQTITQTNTNVNVTISVADLLAEAARMGLPPISEADATRLLELVSNQGVE